MYCAEDAERDSEKILLDEYQFDIWHAPHKFGSTVLETPEVQRQLGSFLETAQLLEFIHSATRETIPPDHTRPVNLKHLTEIPNSRFKGDDFFDLLPFQILVDTIPNLPGGFPPLNFKQLKKDFERDRIIINNGRYVGAAIGIEAIISEVGDTIDDSLLHCQLPLLSPKMKRNFVIHVLNIATRTNSGGIAFQGLQCLIDSQNCMLVPLSNLARSIGIHVSVGAFGIEGSNCLILGGDNNNDCTNMFSGLRVHIQVASFYRLISSETTLIEDDKDRAIEVLYTNCVCLDIDPRIGTIDDSFIFGVPVSGRLNGKLSFQLYSN